MTKCTDSKIRELCKLRKKGYPKSYCAEIAGISKQTLYNWLDEEKHPDEPYATFREKWKEADEEMHEDLLRRAKKEDPKWLLTRLYPDQYHLARKLEVSGAENMRPIEFRVVEDGENEE